MGVVENISGGTHIFGTVETEVVPGVSEEKKLEQPHARLKRSV